MPLSSGNKGVAPLSPKLLSLKRSVQFSFLFLVLLASAVYLQAGNEIEVPSELDIALSSVRKECDSWISRIGPSISWDGISSFRDLWQAPSATSGLGSSVLEESDPKSSYAVSDAMPSSPSISLFQNFDSSVSTSLFRTWGTLTLQGGSTLPYLILNATLWDGDRLVERTRYMMIEVEPGKGRDFDICENCRLSPERGYSCLLEVEGLFVSERRDCLVAEDDPKFVIWDGSGAAYDREATSEKGSTDSRSPSGSAKVASTSSTSKSIGTQRNVEDSSRNLESDGKGRSSDSSSDDQKKADESILDDETSDSGSISDLNNESSDTNSGSYTDDHALPVDIEEPETKDENDYEDYYVGSVTSDKYHRPDCSYAKKIKPENRIFFSDVWEAREAGYSPCKVCESK